MSQAASDSASRSSVRGGSARWGSAERSLRLVGAAAPALLLAAFMTYAVRTGLPAAEVLRQSVAVALTQVLPGALVWRSVRPARGWWFEDIAVGFALGTCLAVGAQIVAGLLQQRVLSGVIPLGVGAVLLLAPATRTRIMSVRAEPLPWWFGPASCAPALALVHNLQSYVVAVPLSWPSGFRAPHVDTYLHLALSAQLAERGPTRFPWVESEPLGYHWFSHAWIAQVARSSGTELDGVLVRFMPALLPVAVALVVAVAALRLSGRPWTGPVAGLLALAGGDPNVFGRVAGSFPVTAFSPSLGLAIPTLLTLVVVLALRWRGEIPRGGLSLMVLVALGLTSAGTKGSTLPLVAAGLALAAVAMALLDRSRVAPVLLDLLVVLACLAFAIVVVFRGSGAGLALDPSEAARQSAVAWLGGVPTATAAVFAVVAAVVAILGRGAALTGLLATRGTRNDPVTYLLAGGGLAGAMAVAVFVHPGYSQYYFAFTGQPLLALGSALGLAVIVEQLGARWRAVLVLSLVLGTCVASLPPLLLGPLTPKGGLSHAAMLVGVAALVVAVGIGVACLVTGWRSLVAVASLTVLVVGGVGVVHGAVTYRQPAERTGITARTPLAVSRAAIDAARWIREHSAADDLVMTNRHCVSVSAPKRCDSRRFVVAAFSERQVLLEGWTATPMSAELGPEGRDSITVDYWHPDLLELNDGFIADPDETARRRLQALGVRWVFVDFTRPHAESLAPFAVRRFAASGVEVYELSPGG